MNTGRCAIYARYSSREQEGIFTIESPPRACRARAWNHGLMMVDDGIDLAPVLSGPSIEQQDRVALELAKHPAGAVGCRRDGRGHRERGPPRDCERNGLTLPNCALPPSTEFRDTRAERYRARKT